MHRKSSRGNHVISIIESGFIIPGKKETEIKLIGSENVLISRCDDADSFAKTIVILSADSIMRKEISESNRTIIQKFDALEIRPKMMKIYADV